MFLFVLPCCDFLRNIFYRHGRFLSFPRIVSYSTCLSGIPNLFGVCVYSFMCHHSLPSLVTPISKKTGLSRLLLVDYALILAFYMLLAFTGIFAFAEIKDLYTLNFAPKQGEVSVGDL